ncbi:hypothetical protein [Streptomyces chromofuscus]|uniref:Uncharacterized protein n=1 Tax=Streptomyces chromofuscus TaxID=42881 RepID=A0A7M2T8F6_STRCW|nr:hypothetical protein [Streptomyces chromofuscus]QOV45016.1 hypothetical protein IPT68_03175 [Streptomyces chromofuscus]GGT28357.1 hypothetical protein GCM10010254_56370 [Streptomyces chromofuscus]
MLGTLASTTAADDVTLLLARARGDAGEAQYETGDSGRSASRAGTVTDAEGPMADEGWRP